MNWDLSYEVLERS